MDLNQLLVTALPALSNEIVKGAGSAAGKDLYERAKAPLRIGEKDVKDPVKIQEAYDANPAAHEELKMLVQSYHASIGVTITINSKSYTEYVAGDQHNTFN
jgi:hypothetical protein